MQKSSKKCLVFCTYSSVYSSIVLKKLLDNDAIEVVGIINSTRVINPRYGFFKGALAQIQRSGWRYASYLFMVTDLFSWLNPSKTIHALAKKKSIPVFNTVDINAVEASHFISSKQPDLLLAAHFNQLVKKPLLDLPCINIHPSLLPAYKGVDPVFYALLDNQPTLGVTLHKMAESFDTGETLLQQEIESTADGNLYSNNCHLFALGAELAIRYLVSEKVQVGEEVTIKGSKSFDDKYFDNKHYDSWPTRSNISKFKQQGKHMISLKQTWQGFRNV